MDINKKIMKCIQITHTGMNNGEKKKKKKQEKNLKTF